MCSSGLLAASSSNSLPAFWDNITVPSSRVNNLGYIHTYTYKDDFVYNKHKDYKNSGITTTKHGSMSLTVLPCILIH
jgi:hypothetical protein